MVGVVPHLLIFNNLFMKLQLDTKLKTIKIEETVNLGELTEMLEKLLPFGAWKEFTLEATIIHNWSSPIVIDKYQPYVPYQNPWWQNPYMGSGDNQFTLCEGTYNLQM